MRSCHRRGSGEAKTKSTAAVLFSAFFLTSGWAEFDRSESLTQRDVDLRKILQGTGEAAEQSPLSVRAARLNELRRAYALRLSSTDNLLQTRISYATGKSDGSRTFGGVSASVRNILQFSENMQSDVQISMARNLMGKTPTLLVFDSELPLLDHIEV
ncbi:MAG: hypothetical protein RIR26_1469, partial [Pseudomonadota bacterium]